MLKVAQRYNRKSTLAQFSKYFLKGPDGVCQYSSIPPLIVQQVEIYVQEQTCLGVNTFCLQKQVVSWKLAYS